MQFAGVAGRTALTFETLDEARRCAAALHNTALRDGGSVVKCHVIRSAADSSSRSSGDDGAELLAISRLVGDVESWKNGTAGESMPQYTSLRNCEDDIAVGTILSGGALPSATPTAALGDDFDIDSFLGNLL